MSCWSGCLGSLDHVLSCVMRKMTPSEDRFFTQGYGDIERVKRLHQDFLQDWTKNGGLQWQERLSKLSLVWDSQESGDSGATPTLDSLSQGIPADGKVPVICRDATFTSPIAEYLSPEVATGHVRFILPDRPVKGIVLHAIPRGVEDYKLREKVARRLADHGLASLLMTAPFYGVRRAHSQTSSKQVTVADYLLQSWGVVIEGVGLLRWLRTTYPSLPLGVTGISWGGAMASCIGVCCRMPVFCVPYLGGTSPTFILTGPMRWQFDWKRLSKEHGTSLEQTKTLLEDEFQRNLITTKTLVESAPRPLEPTIAAMVQVIARDDKWATPWHGQELYDVLSPACRTHSLRFIDGGHLSGIARAETELTSAIVDAFKALT